MATRNEESNRDEQQAVHTSSSHVPESVPHGQPPVKIGNSLQPNSHTEVQHSKIKANLYIGINQSLTY